MSHSSKNTLLSLDINSTSVRALICELQKSGEIKILGTGSAKQQPNAMQYGEIFDLGAVTEACRKAISSAEEASGAFARSAVVNVSGENIKSTISRVHYRRSDSDRIFSEDELSALFEKIEAKTEKKFSRELAFESGSDEVAIELLDSFLSSCTVDGRRALTPVDTESSDVVVEYYTSFAPSNKLEDLDKLFADLKLDLVSITTVPFATFRAISPRKSKDSAIYLNVESDSTNLTIVEDGSLKGAESFSLGTKIIGKDLSVWTSGLKIALSNLPHVQILPPKIILCGTISESDEFQEYLALGNWFNDLPFDRRPVVEIFDDSTLKDISGDFSPNFFSAVCLAKVGFEDLAEN